MAAVADEDVPDYQSVFDGFVFAVEDAAVEEVVPVGEAEDAGEFVDLGLEPFGDCVVADSFGVAAPEFALSSREELDQAAAVVIL